MKRLFELGDDSIERWRVPFPVWTLTEQEEAPPGHIAHPSRHSQNQGGMGKHLSDAAVGIYSNGLTEAEWRNRPEETEIRGGGQIRFRMLYSLTTCDLKRRSVTRPLRGH